MNNQQLIAVKQIYDSLGELMGSPYLQMEFMRKFPQIDIQVKDILYMESLRYMIYLADADGSISSRELNIINYITGKYLTLELVDDLIDLAVVDAAQVEYVVSDNLVVTVGYVVNNSIFFPR